MSNTPRSDRNSVEWDRANRAGCDLEFTQGLEQEVNLWKSRAFRRREFGTEMLSEKLQVEIDLGKSRETVERQSETISKLREESKIANDVALQMTARLHEVAYERDCLRSATRNLEAELSSTKEKLSGKIEKGSVCIASKAFIDEIEKERDELKTANNEILEDFEAIERFREYLFESVSDLEGSLREQELIGDSISQASFRGSFCTARDIRVRFQRAFDIFESAISKIRKIDSKIP